MSYVKELEKKDSTSTKSKLSHGLLNFETIKDNIYSGEEIILPIQFIGDSNQHKFKVWAYLYRGSKCYSCCADCEIVKEREDNMKLFDLSAESTKIIELPLIIDDGLDAGDYKLKIKINKDDQKTDKEITETITIKEKLVSSELEDGQNVLNTNSLNECSNPSYENINSIETKNEYAKIKESSSGVVVYESNSEKAKKLVPTLLMITFALLSLVLAFSIFKKKS